MARRRRTSGAPPSSAPPPRTPVRVAPAAPQPRRWLAYVFAFSFGLALAALIGEVVAADIADQKGRAVDACLEATTILNQVRSAQTTPTPTVTPTTPTTTPTATATATVTPSASATPVPTATGPALVPATPACPEKATGSWLTTVLGLTFYAGVLGVAFASSQVIARRVAGWAYRRRLRRDGGSGGR